MRIRCTVEHGSTLYGREVTEKWHLTARFDADDGEARDAGPDISAEVDVRPRDGGSKPVHKESGVPLSEVPERVLVVAADELQVAQQEISREVGSGGS